MKRAIWLVLIIGMFWGCKHKSSDKASRPAITAKAGQIKQSPVKKNEKPGIRPKTAKGVAQANVPKSVEPGNAGQKTGAENNKKARNKGLNKPPPGITKHYPTPGDIAFLSELKLFKKDIKVVTTTTFSRDITTIALKDKTPTRFLSSKGEKSKPKPKDFKKLDYMLSGFFKKAGISPTRTGLLFNQVSPGKTIFSGIRFFSAPSVQPDEIPDGFKRVVLKKGRYLKVKCSDIMGWANSKNFLRLLQTISGKRFKSVLVGPAFCLSAKGEVSFDLRNKTLYYYCRMVPEGKLTEKDKAMILYKTTTLKKLIPSYLRTTLKPEQQPKRPRKNSKNKARSSKNTKKHK